MMEAVLHVSGVRRSSAVAILLGSTMFLGSAARAKGDELAGSWEGRWESKGTGQKGPLTADFFRLDEATYRVEFRGRFLKLVPFKYVIDLHVRSRDGERITLEGESYLGRMLGTFALKGAAAGDGVDASYSSSKDQGQFILHRCKSRAKP